MNCTPSEFMQYIEDEDIKFVRLTFCDIYGVTKNISVMVNDIERVLKEGLPFNASFIKGFDEESTPDLYLHPDPGTTALLPWRPENGKVIRMFCDIKTHSGEPVKRYSRYILKEAIRRAEEKGISFKFGSRMEFYLFKTDEEGNSTKIPCDRAGYMDIAPLDKGENVRREICLTLERMGVIPVNSHHEAGPGQNEIDFRSSDALTAADHTMTFRNVVRTIAARHGFSANFDPKPLDDAPGSGFHINFRADSADGKQVQPAAIAGVLKHVYESTLFFNPSADSYKRLGEGSAPRYITWSRENRGQLIGIPPVRGIHHYAQLRSPDGLSNPYLDYALIIEAAMDGINSDLELEPPVNSTADASIIRKRLPADLKEAIKAAEESEFIKKLFDDYILKCYSEDR